MLSTFHFQDGFVRNVLALYSLSKRYSTFPFLIVGQDHNDFAEEALEVLHLAEAGSAEHVGLVDDVVAPSLGGQLQHFIEALRARADEHVPAAVVVPLARKPVHLHAVEQRVRAQDVELLLGEPTTEFCRPVSLARTGKADH